MIMQTTILGKGPKCRVCTHPERKQIESMLARGAGISAIKPIMGDAFSRRALYRHRAKHMTALGYAAARPVPFPCDGAPTERIRWLQREAEHTAALAEQRGELNTKLKALHEIARLIWLEQRSIQWEMDLANDGDHLDISGVDVAWLEQCRRRREAAIRAHEDEAFERLLPAPARER